MQHKEAHKNTLLSKYISRVLTVFRLNNHYIIYKYLPISLMLLLSTYVNSLLRGLKDSILVPFLGAELISFIKFYGVFPGTLIFFICFTKLANILPRDKLYYVIVTFFCSFFLLYAFVLFPFKANLQPNLSEIIIEFPKFKYQIMLIENWTISILYIMCEICGTVTLTLLFWQFANDLYTIKEAKKTYALLGVVGQSGIILAGVVQTMISDYFIQRYIDNFLWDRIVQWMIITIVIANVGLIFIYHWIYKNVFFNAVLGSREYKHEQKIKLSISDSLKYIAASRYLWLIMLIVFCYGMGINIVEISWKDQLKHIYPSSQEYSVFIGRFNIYLGISSVLIMILGSYALPKFKWIISALITPIIAFITGVIFFIIVIFKNELEAVIELFNIDIVMMAIILGSAQVILFKSLNYTFLESTKEMAFIPLNRELKTKGKAAIDIIGGRFGKAFGAISQQLMLQFIDPNIINLSFELLSLFIIVILIWIISVFFLNKRFLRMRNSSH